MVFYNLNSNDATMAWVLLVIVALAQGIAAAAAVRGQGTCTAPDPQVTFGEVVSLEHEVGGTARIVDGCTLEIDNFTFDGGAPAVFLWGAPACTPRDIKQGGFRISDQQITKASNGQQLRLELIDGFDWSKVKCISVYCEEAFADLGHAEVTMAAATAASSPPEVLPAATAATSLDDLPSCVELIPGYFNLHWRVEGSDVILGLEGRPGAGNRWLGFGFSPVDATGAQMVGSDVVIGGVVAGECFALNYFLSELSQCDFATGQGVCPDFAGGSSASGTTSAELLACEVAGDALSVMIRRPIGDSDNRTNAWPADASRPSIFAMGPVSEGSDAARPVVLIHQLQLPGTNAVEAVHVTAGSNFSINLAAGPAPSQKACTPLMVPMPSAEPLQAPAPAPAPAPVFDVPVIKGTTKFTVSLDKNPNYPNPPGWGVSYWVNGKESPVLEVQRGTPYTFTVEAGPTHPLYITTSIIGGGSLEDYANETVFAGNDTTFGEKGSATTLTWTPDADTPDLVYYQCAVHQKIGWEIRVSDPMADLAPASAPIEAAQAQADALSPPSSSSVVKACFAAGAWAAAAAALAA